MTVCVYDAFYCKIPFFQLSKKLIMQITMALISSENWHSTVIKIFQILVKFVDCLDLNYNQLHCIENKRITDKNNWWLAVNMSINKINILVFYY